QIDGTGTINKGAELMLYAILEQIEKRYPNAKVIYNTIGKSSSKNIKTALNLRQPLRVRYGRYIKAFSDRLNIDDFTVHYPLKNIDILLDASGFRLGDQFNISNKQLKDLERYYKSLKQRGTKIVLLPQSFGPFETINGKLLVEILNKYVDLIIARDDLSKEYLLNSGGDLKKIYQLPDFTILVKGIFPQNYSFLQNAICIIPNRKMITHTSLEVNYFYNKIAHIIEYLQNSGQLVFFLNHEGEKDLELCTNINNYLSEKITIVDGLNAKEIKGIIGKSKLVISSRYHGVASSLNQGVPCIATSWSHKYDLLFKDFNLSGYIIDLKNENSHVLEKIELLLNSENALNIIKHLEKMKTELERKVEKMWNIVWGTLNI
ncbi:MAG: polysaccharide pyruvyl transferase family protein, partial [archaeon]